MDEIMGRVVGARRIASPGMDPALDYEDAVKVREELTNFGRQLSLVISDKDYSAPTHREVVLSTFKCPVLNKPRVALEAQEGTHWWVYDYPDRQQALAARLAVLDKWGLR
jgi:hypothetical protein